MLISSSRRAGSRSMASDGFRVGKTSSCRSVCSAMCSVPSSSTASNGSAIGARSNFAALSSASAARGTRPPRPQLPEEEVGRLREAPLRRTRAGARVPRALHEPHRHREPQAPRTRWLRRHLLLERLRLGLEETLADPRQPRAPRRFLLHVLPKRFVRIRHFGFLAFRNRTATIERCRTLIAAAHVASVARASDATKASNPASDLTESHPRCSVCKHGRMIEVEILEPMRTASIVPRERESP